MKAITTTYHGPTNSHGSRITASDGDRNQVIVSYRSGLSSEGNHDAAALALCRKMGWTGGLVRGGLMHAGRDAGNVYVWADGGATLAARGTNEGDQEHGTV